MAIFDSLKGGIIAFNTISKVSKKVNIVPTQEPLIVKIIDLETLKQKSSFYAAARVGDEIVIYREFDKAILYRDSTDEIIAQGRNSDVLE